MLFLFGGVCEACASRDVRVANRPPTASRAAFGANLHGRYAERVMSEAEARGVSVVWFNAPLEEARATAANTCSASLR